MKVAPYVGAWIETTEERIKALRKLVAPYVGAWIETRIYVSAEEGFMSHPTWVRGLKPLYLAFDYNANMSHPTWVRGLKPGLAVLPLCVQYCRTLRGCVD